MTMRTSDHVALASLASLRRNQWTRWVCLQPVAASMIERTPLHLSSASTFWTGRSSALFTLTGLATSAALTQGYVLLHSSSASHTCKRRAWPAVVRLHPPCLPQVFNSGIMQTLHDKPIEIKRAVPRDQMPPGASTAAVRGRGAANWPGAISRGYSPGRSLQARRVAGNRLQQGQQLRRPGLPI